MARLQSLVLKYKRFEEHHNTYDQALKWWFQSDPYGVVTEHNPQSGLNEFCVVAHEQPPDRLALIAGDAIQNLRATLDHLICELARTNSGGYLMPAVEEALAFPVTTKKRRFREARRRGRLGMVPPRAQALIHRLQPYRTKGDPLVHPLWVLQQLSNIDKHRKLPLLNSAVSSYALSELLIHSAKHFELVGGGSFKDKTVLARVDPGAKVDVNFEHITIDVAFGEGTPLVGAPVGQTLGDLAKFTVNFVVNPLAQYL